MEDVSVSKTGKHFIVEDDEPNNGKSNIAIEPSVYMIEKLIELTEQSVKAQSSTVNELQGLRTDLKDKLKAGSKERSEIMTKIDNSNKSTIRTVADWVATNPLPSAIMFLIASFSAVLIVLISQTINPDTINSIRTITTKVSTPMSPAQPQRYP